MAKKQKKIAPVKHVSRQQLSRRQRERKIQRIVIIVGVALLVMVVALAGYGYYDSQYKPYHQTVLEVNDTRINMDYYLDMLRAYLSGSDASSASLLASAVLPAIQRNLFIIQGAPDLGYSIAESEIDAAIKENQLPDKPAYRDLFTAQTLQERLTNDYFGKNVPESVEQAKVEAMVFETEEVALEGIKKINEGTTFTEIAKIYGVEKLTKERGGDLGWLPKGLTADVLDYSDASVLENTAFKLQAGEISQPVYDANVTKGTGYWIVKVEEKDGDESAHVRVILLGSMEEAQRVKQQLDMGMDFATIAKEVSQDSNSKEDGGDLGWLRKGYEDTSISDMAFSMKAGEISEPLRDVAVETKGGYWVVKVLEKEASRALDEEIRDGLIETEFEAWLMQRYESSEVKELLTEEQQNWAVNKVIQQLGGS